VRLAMVVKVCQRSVRILQRIRHGLMLKNW
jgi:hypothetical protein